MASNSNLKDSTTEEDSELPSTEGEDEIMSQIIEKSDKLKIFVHIINPSVARTPLLISRLYKVGCYILNPIDMHFKSLEEKDIRTGLSIKIPNHKYMRKVKINPALLDINIKMTYYYNDLETDELIIRFKNLDKIFEKRLLKSQCIAEYWIKKKLNKSVELIIQNNY